MKIDLAPHGKVKTVCIGHSSESLRGDDVLRVSRVVGELLD
jgi:hypothetical protein